MLEQLDKKYLQIYQILTYNITRFGGTLYFFSKDQGYFCTSANYTTVKFLLKSGSHFY